MVEPIPFINKGHRANSGNNNSREKTAASFGKKSIDLDELFEFNAARERALERNACRPAQGPPFAEFVPQRVFINHIDSLNGKRLASYIADQAMGIGRQESLEEAEEVGEEENEMFDGEFDGEGKEELFLKSKTEERYFYEVIGTLEFANHPGYRRTEDIFDIIDQENKSEFISKILPCGFIIYDITAASYCHPFVIEEAALVLDTIMKKLENMERSTPKTFSKYTDCRTFILISPLMTWAKTKPVDPDDPDLAFTEADYRKRKPHPNYKIHCEFEKRVIEMGKRFPKNLRTIVIGSGITYGHEEDVLHFLFQMAWLNAPHLPLFKPGKNLIPMIHVDSLASVVHNTMEEFPKKFKYIVACEQIPTKLKDIVKLIAKKLGNGKVVKVSKEEAFLYPEIKQRNYDMLTVNLNILPGYIIEKMDVKWNSELPFIENVGKMIMEFKKSRGLEPVKIFIHGPPASGKTFLAKRLAQYYQIHYLGVKEVIESTIQKMKERIDEKLNKGKNLNDEKQDKIEIEGEDAEEDEDDEDDELEEDDIDGLRQTLIEIEVNMRGNEKNRLDEQYVIRFFKEMMSSNACQNQGYIIDGYPKTLELTNKLYEPDENAEEALDEEEEDEPGQGNVEHLFNAKIMPEFVESLDASDEFLIRRVIALPEDEIQNTHYVEDEMCRRLNEFRELNTEDNTPLIFYDETDVHPMIYNVELDSDPQMEPTFQAIIKHVGPPKNYGLQGAELEHQLELEDKKRCEEKYDSLKAKEEEARISAQQRREKMEHWMLLKNQEKEMEEKALAILAMPLRHYLMKYIFPTLTRGLVEVARVRPDDPVDFLAEYLFRENPEGKMFQPDYFERGEELAKTLEECKHWKEDGRSIDAESLKDTGTIDESVISDAISNVSDINRECFGIEKESKISLTSSKKESERIYQAEEEEEKPSESSFGSCSCSSTRSTSSGMTPPGTVCKCPPYSSSSTTSRSSKSSGKSVESARLKCKCNLISK